MSILFAFLLFSLLIFVHELGHFVAAKLSGIQVNEFAMFMGPAIFKKQIGQTLYSIRCIPFGGYCAMEGEDEDTPNPRSFQKASWWKRFIVLVSGAAMNFIAGLLIFAIVFLPQDYISSATIVQIEEGCAIAGEQGIQVGDRFLEIDGETVYTQSDFSMILMAKGGQVHDLVLERNGEKIVLEDFRMEMREFENEDGTKSLRYGFSFGVVEPTFGQKLQYVWDNAMSTIQNVKLSLQMLVSGKAGLSEVSGPVGIVDIMADTAEQSASAYEAFLNMMYLGGFIAINLAVMNLLPIPALDGGRVVCLLITAAVEGITKKKINPKYEGYIHGAGMILLLLLMAVIMLKDVIFIFKG